MQAKLWLLMAAVALASCGSASKTVAPAPAAGVLVGEPQTAPDETRNQRPALRTELLPAFVRTGTLNMDASLLQRPKVGSVILTTLAAGQTVQILGTLDNAEGQWVSVGVGDAQGWVRAVQVTQ